MGAGDSLPRTGVDKADPSPAGQAASSPKLSARRKHISTYPGTCRREVGQSWVQILSSLLPAI